MSELQIGKKQTLTVIKKVEFGVYLGSEEDKVLLPGKQVPDGTGVGDSLEVFLYRDSEDRIIATTNTPKLQLGEVALLTVKDVTKIGAFLDWGLEKDLLLPFREQTTKVIPGEQYLVALYLDKSSRLCATMKIYHYLEKAAPDLFQKEQEVRGRVYEISDNFGTFVAIEDRYSALIPKKQMYGALPKVGDEIEARITAVKADGKIDLAMREKAYLQMDVDAARILELIGERGGRLSFNDKVAPEVIKEETGMSKNEFKRAVGRLYKEHKIIIKPDSIELV